MTNHKLDTDKQVFFYEQEFYVLSNFSSFKVRFKGTPWEEEVDFQTAEHCYHYQKFERDDMMDIRGWIRKARSAHKAFQIARAYPHLVRRGWSEDKFDVMRNILRAKASQHEYVSRKLLETGDRELVEDSWRDACWGWGENGDGQNMLGKLWMEVRAELREKGASV